MNTRFNVCDLNAIETRVGAWLAECHDLMNVFQPYIDAKGKYHPNGKDLYIAFAVKIYGTPYELLQRAKEGELGKQAKTDAKGKRQFGKVGVLGCIYRMGGGQWGRGKSKYKDPETGEYIYDKIRTALWGFAYAQGVELTQEQAHMIVRVFRDSYPEICGTGRDGGTKGIWTRLEEAVLDVMDPKHPETERRVGPNGCVLIDKVNISGRHSMMRMQLPSGRRLHYLDAHIEDTLMPWKTTEGEDVYRPALWYATEDQISGQWSETTTHGGKLFENLVQGTARDVLAVKLLEFEEHDMSVVGHVHDEGIALVPDDPFSPSIEDMVHIMSKPIDWAPGLLLGADGFEGSFYHK